MSDGILADPESVRRSWYTRMESVMRQFRRLTEEEVMDDSGDYLEIIGLCRGYKCMRVTVIPAGASSGVFSTDLDQLTP